MIVHGIFKRALKACGCAWLTQQVWWLSVRVFGPKFEATVIPPDVRDVLGVMMDGD